MSDEQETPVEETSNPEEALLKEIQKRDAKLSKARTFLVELFNAHEARGKIQSGWKYNAKEIIDLIDG